MTAASTAARPAEAAPAATAAPYERLSAAERYIHETRDRAFLALLRRHGVDSLRGRRILEVGCAEGSLLRTLLFHGAGRERLTGLDIDGARVRRARIAAHGATVVAGDGARLPYADAAFDLVCAFTFFTSVVDPEARRHSAAEALRVLRPGGLLVVYDFWTNPLNSRVRPLRAAELRALFAPRPVEIERVTLAPPIVRALGGRRALCAPLERIAPLRTHLLAAVEKEA